MKTNKYLKITAARDHALDLQRQAEAAHKAYIAMLPVPIRRWYEFRDNPANWLYLAMASRGVDGNENHPLGRELAANLRLYGPPIERLFISTVYYSDPIAWSVYPPVPQTWSILLNHYIDEAQVTLHHNFRSPADQDSFNRATIEVLNASFGAVDIRLRDPNELKLEWISRVRAVYDTLCELIIKL